MVADNRPSGKEEKSKNWLFEPVETKGSENPSLNNGTGPTQINKDEEYVEERHRRDSN